MIGGRHTVLVIMLRLVHDAVRGTAVTTSIESCHITQMSS
jgi:hypothetical protein